MRNEMLSGLSGLSLIFLAHFALLGGTEAQASQLGSGPAPESVAVVDGGDEAGQVASDPYRLPLRVSREFFAKNLVADIEITQPQVTPALYSVTSQTAFEERPSELPEPTEPFIADFRDRPGCVLFEKAPGLELCFNLVPDVSSVDVTRDKVQARGLQEFAQQELSAQSSGECSDASLSNLEFLKAEKSADNEKLDLYFGGRVESANADCARDSIQFKLTLS